MVTQKQQTILEYIETHKNPTTSDIFHWFEHRASTLRRVQVIHHLKQLEMLNKIHVETTETEKGRTFHWHTNKGYK